LIQKFQISGSIEYGGTMIGESGCVDLDRAENLDALPLPSDRNLRLVPNGHPSLIQRRILAKTGLVFENQRGPFGGGFFSDWGTCIGAICFALPDLLAPAFV
jgi:hypothetical protein